VPTATIDPTLTRTGTATGTSIVDFLSSQMVIPAGSLIMAHVVIDSNLSSREVTALEMGGNAFTRKHRSASGTASLALEVWYYYTATGFSASALEAEFANSVSISYAIVVLGGDIDSVNFFGNKVNTGGSSASPSATIDAVTDGLLVTAIAVTGSASVTMNADTAEGDVEQWEQANANTNTCGSTAVTPNPEFTLSTSRIWLIVSIQVVPETPVIVTAQASLTIALAMTAVGTTTGGSNAATAALTVAFTMTAVAAANTRSGAAALTIVFTMVAGGHIVALQPDNISSPKASATLPATTKPGA
jgi:hypothetical protein